MTTEDTTDPSDFFAGAAEEATEGDIEKKTWRPEPGEMLRGTLRRGELVIANGKPTHLIELNELDEDDDGKLVPTGDIYTVWCSSAALKKFVVEEAPAKDALVFLQFHEKVPQENDPSRSYNRYSCKTERSDYDYWHLIRKKFNARQEAAAAGEHLSSNDASAQVKDSGIGADLEDPF